MYKRLSAVLFLFVAIPLYAAEPAQKHGAYYGGKATEYPSWFKESFLELREDIREAEKANKRVVIMFTQDNCPYCNLLVERRLHARRQHHPASQRLRAAGAHAGGARLGVGQA